ncbi:MAG: ABC transporter permease subunit [Streptosporangiaceae bacterium]
MTVLRVPAHSEHDARPQPLPWRRMAWVTWRQHRIALAGAATLLGGLALYLWIAGLQIHHDWTVAVACHPADSGACGALAGYVISDWQPAQIIATVLQAVPALIGAFVGAPVLAREMETGTFRYAWTQGFGRWRWTLAKLVPLAVLLAVAAGAFSALLSWYYQPFLSGTPGFGGSPVRLEPGMFDLLGVAFAAWTLAAFAIGALAGMLIRRVVPAIVATLAAYTGLALAAGLYLRQHYMTPLLVKNADAPGSAWVISQLWYGKNGQPVSQTTLGNVLQQAPQLGGGKGGVPQDDHTVNQYLVQHGYTLWTSYQPGSRFWPFQWIEGGWLLVLSVLLIAAAVWLVRRRAA